MDVEQENLIISVKVGKTTIELIKHRDLHRWVYLNGQLTDVRHPRHIQLYRDVETPEEIFELSKEFIYGESRYNKERISKIFRKVLPEEFI